MPPQKLQKSSHDKIIFGVCGGLAEYFSIDPVLVRVIFVVLAFASGIGFLLYILLAIIMPRPETGKSRTADIVSENIQNIGTEAQEAIRRARDTVYGPPLSEQGPQEMQTAEHDRRNLLALVLIVLGLLLLLANLGIFWWFNWDTFWPLLLIAIGIAIIIGYFRRRS